MGHVKLVSTIMLQNQRQALGTLDGACKTCKTCKCYKIKDQQNISTESTLTQINTESSLEVLTQQVIFFDLF
jgi:hypothetical protein